jgi:hypothetical protein
MQAVSINLISDLEHAIAAGSDKTGAMLQRITDLFLLDAGHYSADQLAVYDEVLSALIDKIGVAARAKLAQRLAPIGAAPTKAIRSLALDSEIEVAEPVLSRSSALDDETLGRCIAINGQQHLLAIATRNTLSEAVSGQLVEKGNRQVLGILTNNPGAAISDPSYGVLVQKSVGDDWLSTCVAKRNDIPEHHFRELMSKASEVVRQELMAGNPEHSEVIKQMFPADGPLTRSKGDNSIKNYGSVERVVKSQPITEAVVKEYSEAKKVDEVVVSIAQLSSLSVYEVERLFVGRWSSPVAIILKAIGFHLSTIDAIYRSRLTENEVVGSDLVRTKAEFIAISRATAERIMRFLAVKTAAKISNLSKATP